jgi:hypothetical protein
MSASGMETTPQIIYIQLPSAGTTLEAKFRKLKY